ncbi:MAG: DMT family transporter [Formosimonas sp.]
MTSNSNPSPLAYGTLWFCAILWGGSFVFQKMAMSHIEPLFFNMFRCTLSVITLLPFLVISSVQDDADFDFLRWHEFKLGLCLGILLWLALGAQQIGIVTSTASKAAFINGLYIVFVPFIMRLLFGKTIALWQFGMLGLAGVGVFLLTTHQRESLNLNTGDALVLLGTMIWALHLCILGRYAKKCRALPIAMMQMLICAILSGASSLFIGEVWTWQGTFMAIPSLIYTGILSGGIAFTLQIYGQRSVKSSEASIILSFEVIFGSLAGWYFLNEPYSVRSTIGALLILTTIVLIEMIHYFQTKYK